MVRRFAFALLVGLVAAAPAHAVSSAGGAIAVDKAIEGFVRPVYVELEAKADAAVAAVSALCQAPSQAGLDAARDAFSGLVEAWSEAEIVRFGPIAEENRLERMLFWPDRKGIGLKQVQAALAAKDPAAADATALAGKSVAVQGLGALEYILFGTESDRLAASGDGYRCAFGAAVAGNVDAMARAVNAAWTRPDGFAAQWSAPNPDNALYRNGSESLTELVEVFIDGLETIRDVRLNGFLGASADADKPKQAIWWRSGNTQASLAAGLRGMDRLLTASGLADILPQDDGWIADSMHVQLLNGIDAVQAAFGPINEALADPDRRARLEHLRLVTTSLSNLAGTRLTGAFGLSAGFSSLDGD